VRLREEAFFQEWDDNLSLRKLILPGIKLLGDYSVYPVGKMALRWNRRTTKSRSYNTQSMEMSARGKDLTPDPRNSTKITRCTDQDCDITPTPATFNPWSDDFLLSVRENVTWITSPTKSGGARTDMLDITYSDWTTPEHSRQALQIEGETVETFLTYRGVSGGVDLPAPPTLPGSNESWNNLLYFKPNNLVNNTDTGVTGRRTDYRGPAALAFTTGTAWNDAAENSGSDTFNESEGAYVLNANPTQPSWATFSINGATTTRYAPFFKMRQWRSVHAPASVKVDTVTLTRNVDYRADVKPIARAPFAQNLLWHSTLESTAAITGPDGGFRRATAPATARAGYNGASFVGANNNVRSRTPG
jgi:hypothetical protein